MTRAQAGAPVKLDVSKVDLTTLDPATLDFAALRPADVLALSTRYHERGDHLKALQVLQGEITDLEVGVVRDPATSALLHYLAADAERRLRRFEPALESLVRSEDCLHECVSELDPGTAAGRTLSDWAETLYCSYIGLRGWIFQDWGALDTAQALFERQRAELDRLAELGIDVSRVRGDADKQWANLAMQTAAPERIEALLSEREARGDPDAVIRAYLKLRLAGALGERSRRQGLGLERVRAAFAAAFDEPELEPIDRIFGELWLADLELEDDHAAARELWRSAGARMEELAASGSRARRSWVALGARLAETSEERASWRATVASEIEAFLAEWRALDVREGGYGLLSVSDPRLLYCEYTALARELDGEELGARAALELLARAHAESTLARKLGAQAPTLEEIREALCPRPDQGVLVYLAASARGWVFALDRSTLRALPFSCGHELEGSRRSLVRELLASGGLWTDAARTAARELARLLLPGELRAWLEGRSSIAVCGLDLFLGDVPFELLDLGEGRLVGAEKSVWNLPPLAASVEIARRAARAGPVAPGACLLAAPTLSPEIAAVFGLTGFQLDAGTLAAILDVFPPGARKVLVGDQANAGALAEPGQPVLQFLAHGAFDEARSRSAELVLAATDARDDGLLSVSDVERIWHGRSAPSLVLLTACRAGRGVQRCGDYGATDLGGAFLACGTRAVVASPYDLDLAVVCRLSDVFYEALESGADAAEALRRARVELSRDPDFAASMQPSLLRAIGFAPAPFLPAIEASDAGAESGGGAGVSETSPALGVILSSSGALACLLVLGGWFLVRARRRTAVKGSG